MAGLVRLRNADVYAPETLGRRDLLLAGGRIVALESSLPALSGVDAEVIDLEGRRLIPGLVDGHVHVTGGGGEMGFRSRVAPLAPAEFTAAGITTVIGLLGTDDIARTTRDLLARVYALREAGLSAFAHCGGYHLPAATLTGSVRDDLVFIEALIGVGEVAISDHRSSQPSLEELVRLASEAHVAGLLTGKAGIVHLHLGDGVRGLEPVRRALARTELPARVFQPTHVNRRRALFEEALELARAGSPVDITAFPVADGDDAWSAAEAVSRALEAGIDPARLTVSSDAGGNLSCVNPERAAAPTKVGAPGALLGALQDLLELGLPLAQALPAFTSNPARYLRLAGKGRIARGAEADLLALGENHAPDLVLARGRVHVRDGVQVKRGGFEHGPGAG